MFLKVSGCDNENGKYMSFFISRKDLVRKTQNYNAAVSECPVQTTLSLSFEFDVHVTVHRDKFL